MTMRLTASSSARLTVVGASGGVVLMAREHPPRSSARGRDERGPSQACYSLMFMVTPEAPSVNLTPRLVDLSVTRTPFWFCIVEMLPPPPTVAPAPTAV